MSFFADVARHQHGFAARFFYYVTGGFTSILVFVQVRYEHIDPLAGKGDRYAPANPRIAPGDQRFPAAQLTRTPVRCFAVIGFGLLRND
ncbi:hypothetical protein GCM10027577_32150 [Spirosoma fluminis]